MTTLDRIDLRPGIEPQEIRGTLLSKPQIFKRIEEGTIIISPFDPECVNSSSVDVRLGPWYYRAQKPQPGMTHYNPYSKADVERVWGQPQYAEVASELYKRIGIPLDEGVFPEDLVILIGPGESILGHTLEFIGGRHNITQSMQARSTAGRNLMLVCKCAGWGDIGYINRWTMELKNDWNDYTMALVVGRRYAQLVFHETGLPIDDHDSYGVTGKYQTSPDLATIKQLWTYNDMLPKMYNDREIKRRMIYRPEEAPARPRNPNLLAASQAVTTYGYCLDDKDLLVVRNGEVIARNKDPLKLGHDRRDLSTFYVGTIRQWIAQGL